MKTKLILAFALLLVGTCCKAQTIYTQTAQVLCDGGVRCNLTMVDAEGHDHTFLINCPQDAISVYCNGVVFDGEAGRITEVVTYFPLPGKSGPYSFKFELNDGRTGSLSGHGSWFRAGRSWQAEVDSSTLTVN